MPPVVKPTGRRTFLGTAPVAALPQRAFGRHGGGPNNGQEPTSVKVKMTFDGRTMTATLYGDPSARDPASMLPLDLTVDDCGNNEDIEDGLTQRSSPLQPRGHES